MKQDRNLFFYLQKILDLLQKGEIRLDREKCSKCGCELDKEQTYWPNNGLNTKRKVVVGACSNCAEEEDIPFNKLPQEIKDIVSVAESTSSEMKVFGFFRNY